MCSRDGYFLLDSGFLFSAKQLCPKSRYKALLCVLCVSVVHHLFEKTTTEAQSTQRLHREEAYWFRGVPLLPQPTFQT
jgi:hypothetical protein